MGEGRWEMGEGRGESGEWRGGRSTLEMVSNEGLWLASVWQKFRGLINSLLIVLSFLDGFFVGIELGLEEGGRREGRWRVQLCFL
jgi:hypothetical protein